MVIEASPFMLSLLPMPHSIPDNELWLHEPSFARKLDRALEWAEQHPRVETDLSKLEAKLEAKLTAKTARPRTRQKK